MTRQSQARFTQKSIFLGTGEPRTWQRYGRTGVRGVIPDNSDKVVPVYFRKGIQGLREKMLHGDQNPFEIVFVVTVHVTRLGGDVQAYTVADIHDSFPRPEYDGAFAT